MLLDDNNDDVDDCAIVVSEDVVSLVEFNEVADLAISVANEEDDDEPLLVEAEPYHNI